eukprot:m.6077 g.6077  ORF g.6077 m.6077 type:complete len:60 (-) comp8197_c0_seq4:375-554(-)
MNLASNELTCMLSKLTQTQVRLKVKAGQPFGNSRLATASKWQVQSDDAGNGHSLTCEHV